jgi:hypothetical protein
LSKIDVSLLTPSELEKMKKPKYRFGDHTRRLLGKIKEKAEEVKAKLEEKKEHVKSEKFSNFAADMQRWNED